MHCTVPENIYTSPAEDMEISRGMGWQKKISIPPPQKVNGNPRGWGWQKKISKPPPQRDMEIPRGRGVVKENIHTSPTEDMEIPRGRGVVKENIHTSPTEDIEIPRGGGGKSNFLKVKYGVTLSIGISRGMRRGLWEGGEGESKPKKTLHDGV